MAQQNSEGGSRFSKKEVAQFRETSQFFQDAFQKQVKKLASLEEHSVEKEVPNRVVEAISTHLPQFQEFMPLLFHLLSSVDRWENSTPFDEGFLESDREHVIGMMELAAKMEDRYPQMFSPGEWRNIYGEIAIHDFPEVLVDDVARNHVLYDRTSSRRHKREAAALRFALSHPMSDHIPEVNKKAILRFYDRYEQRAVNRGADAYLVKFLDTYQGNQVALKHFDNVAQQEDANLSSIPEVEERNRKMTDIALRPLLKNGDAFFQLIGEKSKKMIADMVSDQLQVFSDAGYRSKVLVVLEQERDLKIRPFIHV
jgi:hypothetical protein